MERVFGDSVGKSTEGEEMRTKHKHCELIKAWADGAEIQYREDSARMWTDIINPLWDVMFEYRIKPRTVKREGWINLYKVNYGIKPGVDIFDTEADARRMALPRTVATVKVEWEEEEE